MEYLTDEENLKEIEAEMKQLKAKECHLNESEKTVEMRKGKVYNISQQTNFLKLKINDLEQGIEAEAPGK